MNRTLHGLLLFAAMLLLSACGFHLKGLGGTARPLPFGSAYIEFNGTQLGPQLHTELARNNTLWLLESPKQAEAIISLMDEQQNKDVFTINSGGRVNEYLLTYHVTVRTVIGGIPVEPDMQVSVRRTMNYSDSGVLGKEQEEALLWSDARHDAAEQIVRRLTYLTRPAQLGPVQLQGPQSLKPADANPQP